MTNYSEIKQAIKNKNWKSEEYISTDALPEGLQEKYIGFSLGTGVWYWFKILVIGGDHDQNSAQFVERYSQNNGKSNKGLKCGFKAEEMVKSAINPDYQKIWS